MCGVREKLSKAIGANSPKLSSGGTVGGDMDVNPAKAMGLPNRRKAAKKVDVPLFGAVPDPNQGG